MNDGMTAVRMRPRRDTRPGDYVLWTLRNRRARDREKRANGKPIRRYAHMEIASSRFICKTCGRDFPTPELLGAHWREERPELFHPPGTEITADDQIRCLKCGRNYADYGAASNHLRFCRGRNRE